jgi:1-acyl-sn-glycerol-3-phosphate acyltransferase
MNSSSEAQELATSRRDPARALRYALRTPLLLLHLGLGLPLTVLMINPLTARWRIGGERVDHRVIRAWSLGMMRIFGFRVRRFGTPLPDGAMFVANHVSWMDITLLHSQRVVGFVAKSEISRWPLIGWLGRRGGTIYHRRGSNESLNGVLHQMVARLQSGQAVGVFPEGGTTPGDSVRTFHARIFQAAVVAQTPVQPVALRYGADGEAQTIIAFAPGENLVRNLLRVLGEPARVAEVHFLEPVLPGGEGRRHLAETCRERIVVTMQAR